MHYLVTGGCGFIGTHLVKQLLADGHAVTIMDDLSNSVSTHVPAKARLLVQDMTHPGALDKVVADADGIFHLAAVVSVVKSAEAWLPTHRVTLGGTVTLLDTLARLTKQIPVVYASSAAVYGDQTAASFDEQGPATPISAYGADKLACELHARVGTLVHGIPSIGLRFFNVYGTGQDASSPYAGVISIFADRFQHHKPVTIYGDGEQTRDYIYIHDVVTAMQLAMAALEKKAVTSGVFNICTGSPISVNKLAQALAFITSSKAEISHTPARAGDIRHSLGNPALAKQVLGFKAHTSLQDGLELMLGKR